MNFSTKKIVVWGLLALIVLGIGGWFVFKPTNPDSTNNPSENNFFGSIFGNSNDTDNNLTPPTSQNEGSEQTGQSDSVLQKIDSLPVAGAAVVEKDNKEIIRYIDKNTGHIYDKGTSGSAVMITNTTIPAINKVWWSPNAKSLILQIHVDNAITTMAGEIVENGEESILNTSSLPENNGEIAIREDGKKVFYMTSTQNGSEGFLSDFNGSNRVKIFTSPLKEWLVSWPSLDRIVLASKPSAAAEGYAYLLNTQGSTKKILGPISGLMVLSREDTKNVLFGKPNDPTSLQLLDIETGASRGVGVLTFPEKCVWETREGSTVYCAVPSEIPPDTYPDAWYQGRVSFNDSIWKINTFTGNITKVVDLSKEKIDAVDLQLSPKKDRLLFINKKDSTLWSLKLTQ